MSIVFNAKFAKCNPLCFGTPTIIWSGGKSSTNYGGGHPLVSSDGGKSWGSPIKGVDYTFKTWVETARCDATKNQCLKAVKLPSL